MSHKSWKLTVNAEKSIQATAQAEEEKSEGEPEAELDLKQRVCMVLEVLKTGDRKMLYAKKASGSYFYFSELWG